jgi:RHS repeat-associated protein
VESRTEYDAYGIEYNVLVGTKSQFKFAGKHGYYTDDRSGMQLLGSRYYMPALGRFLNQDLSGHKAGLNLYSYCSNNPNSRLDPNGRDWKDFKNWWYENITETIYGWGNALHATAGFLIGAGSDRNIFQAGDTQTIQLKKSDVGHAVEMAVIGAGNGYLRDGIKTIRGSVGSLSAFISTIAQPTNGTQAQVGGCNFEATRVGNNVYVHVHNEISMKSLMYHWGGLSSWQGWDRASSGFGPLGTVRQDFYWTIPVPQYWRK